MQQEFSESSTYSAEKTTTRSPRPSHHGIHQLQQDGTAQNDPQYHYRTESPQSVRGGSPDASVDGVNADQLEERLCRLNVGTARSKAPGQRISEYEKALTPSAPRQALGFKVIRRANAQANGAQLADFPNGSWTRTLPVKP
jgi:hypothetical protein